MMKVVSISGDKPIGVPEVNQHVVEVLSEAREKAQFGEVTGAVTVTLNKDGLTEYNVTGRICSYSIIGALDIAKQVILDELKSK